MRAYFTGDVQQARLSRPSIARRLNSAPHSSRPTRSTRRHPQTSAPLAIALATYHATSERNRKWGHAGVVRHNAWNAHQPDQ